MVSKCTEWMDAKVKVSLRYNIGNGTETFEGYISNHGDIAVTMVKDIKSDKAKVFPWTSIVCIDEL